MVSNTSLLTRRILLNARLPKWLLASDWPVVDGAPVLGTIEIKGGRVASVTPVIAPHDLSGGTADATTDATFDVSAGIRTETLDLRGALVLPGLLEAHAHIDKAYTRARLGALEPGLLAAIQATHRDRVNYTRADLRMRTERALEAAARAGVTRLRTHVDWINGTEPPLAWEVLAELAPLWRDRLHLQCIAFAPLPAFKSRANAQSIVRHVQATPDAVLGGFIHTSSYDADALDNLLAVAGEAGLDLDLHVDEELEPSAVGLASIARRSVELGFGGRIVCSHVCALAAMPEADALSILDRVARAPISLVTLPITNLFLQDATVGRTPRERGITLFKEARERGIPVLIGSDNVQDAFCSIGNHDPVDALRFAIIAGQLDDPFDVWSQSICRTDWVSGAVSKAPSLVGLQGALTVFPDTDPYVWPAADTRWLIRDGSPLPTAI